MLLTESQQMVRDTMRSFAQKRLAPFAAEWDRNHSFPREALVELGALGAQFFGRYRPALLPQVRPA